MQTITLLGATGSIGMSTLDVVAQHPDRYRIFALTAYDRIDELAEQCRRFQPAVAVVGTAQGAQRLQALLQKEGHHIDVMYGEGALCEVAKHPACDIVMAAIVGGAGLPPALAAAHAGKKILLANKEALVMSGHLFMDAVAKSGAVLMPIDSEHNAIFQCLPPDYAGTPALHGVNKIVLTASGGPFLTRPLDTFDSVTIEEAVAHPKWVMGRKISVDSATMMNKGLEVIEAHYLFGMAPSEIEVVIHPQSVVHSMVSYADGSVLAQLGNPDMKIPIAHALAYPSRMVSGVDAIDLTRIAQLTFVAPDFRRFPCLKLAYDALLAGGCAPIALNAANEVAVQAFLDARIGFQAISGLVARVLDTLSSAPIDDITAVFEADRRARELANTLIES